MITTLSRWATDAPFIDFWRPPKYQNCQQKDLPTSNSWESTIHQNQAGPQMLHSAGWSAGPTSSCSNGGPSEYWLDRAFHMTCRIPSNPVYCLVRLTIRVFNRLGTSFPPVWANFWGFIKHVKKWHRKSSKSLPPRPLERFRCGHDPSRSGGLCPCLWCPLLGIFGATEDGKYEPLKSRNKESQAKIYENYGNYHISFIFELLYMLLKRHLGWKLMLLLGDEPSELFDEVLISSLAMEKNWLSIKLGVC